MCLYKVKITLGVTLLYVPKFFSRTVMNYLKLDGIVGLKACRVIIYKIFDVIKMYHHWKLPVPQYLTDLSNGIVRRMHPLQHLQLQPLCSLCEL